MIAFPCAKINLGLNIVGVRPDRYHNIETVFYPIPLHDTLEICKMDEQFPSEQPCDLKITGNVLEGKEEDNLVVKAYRLLAKDFSLPRIHTHLFKKIPSQAGLGGGSSNAAFMIRMLNQEFHLNIGADQMECYAAAIGADCAFFIKAEPAYATGIGNELAPLNCLKSKLQGYYLALIKPQISVSTKDAYAEIEIRKPVRSCCEIVRDASIESWRGELTNDFEIPAFRKFPELKQIKEKLYEQGALYAAMSGSGSCIYGIFNTKPVHIDYLFKNCFTSLMVL